MPDTCAIAGSSVGYKHTEEFRIWQANRVRGNRHSTETKIKMSKSHIGRIVSKETCARISAAKTGKVRLLPLIVTGKPLIKNGDGTWH